MSTQIKSYELSPIFIQAGYGIPDHISSLGSEYTDLYTALKYVNKDGLAYWVQMVDSTYTGSTFTGGIVTGPTIFIAGVTANTVSATTYYGSSSGLTGINHYYVSGSTPVATLYDGDRWFDTTNGIEFVYLDDGNSSQWIEPNPGLITALVSGGTGGGGTFTGGTITGFATFLAGLASTSVSATNYYGLPLDIYVTGGTYSSGTLTFKNNSGGTFTILGFNTGGTITGSTFFSNGLSANTISATTYLNLPFKYYAETSIIPSTSPVASGTSSVAIGDSAKALGINILSLGTGAGGGISSNNSYSTFVGYAAGFAANNITNSNFFGYNAGNAATGATFSNFIGGSGSISSNVNFSNFLGNGSGSRSLNINYSNFIGYNAGYSATSSYSTFIGYQAGYNSIGSNNIIIGTNISLPNNTTNAINIGGVLFGTGTYSNSGTTSITPNNGKIGINVVTPSEALHVSGNTLIQGNLTATTISATSINRVNYIIFNTGTTSGSTLPGTVYFDNTEKSLSYNTSINQGVTVNMGQQQYLRVFNNSGVTIPKGKALEVLSGVNGLPSVTLAVNKHIGFNIVGVSAEDIPTNFEGIAITNGIISNISITGVSIGSLLYASDSVPGQLDNSLKYLNFPLTARTNSIGYVMQTGTTTGKLFVNIQNENNVLAFTDLERDVLEGNVISTGAFNFSGITLASSTTFNVGALQGWIVDNTTNPLKPDATYIYYSGQTGLTTPYLFTDTESYILINSGNTVTIINTYPSPQQRRQNIYLGKLGHANKTSLINAFNETDFDVSPLSQIRDMFTPIRLINSGVIPSPNGANLNFNTSAGILWGLGINFTNNQLNPNSFSVSGNSPTTFQYRTQTGGTSTNTTTIIAGSYDLNGVITTIGSPAKQATNQRIYLVQNGVFRIQYGQKIYADLTTAIAAAQTETFNTFANFKDNAILIGILSLRSDTTNLSDSAYANFLSVSKFGELMGGTGGLSTTTLQQAYNNSSNPEILTNSTLGGLTIKNGTGNDDSITNLLEGLNTTGNTTSFIRADGLISGITLQTNSFIANSAGVSATTISATTYQNLPIKYYAEFSAAPVTSPIVLSGNSIAIGDSAQARNINMFVVGNFAGYQATGASNSNFIGYYAGYQATGASNSNFFGNNAGFQATGASLSNFIGQQAGFQASGATGSNFFSQNAGYLATNANNSNFFGIAAGQNATNANYSNFFGNTAGQNAINANNSNFLGYQAGQNATGASNSNFLGGYAGYQATAAQGSNFFGNQAGYQATGASFSNFLGGNAGYQATGASLSNFIGNSAGYQASGATGCNFLGQNAGRSATNATYSNFLGSNAGQNATNATYSNFLGSNAGYQATNANNSNFLGNGAGFQATSANNSNFFGINAGYQATGASYSTFIGQSAGYVATSANYSNFFGINAGQSATGANNSNFFGNSAGFQATNASGSNFFGNNAGFQATNASGSNFFGNSAGYQATNAFTSNFIGIRTGYQATNGSFSNFIGYEVGYQATGASFSNFIGHLAGKYASDAQYSNFIGLSAGQYATGASFSNFIGQSAGQSATTASNSNFIGNFAGYQATGASYSTFIGYRAGYSSTLSGGVGSNNVIIGTNISLSAGTTNSINIGGVLFGTGTYSSIFGNLLLTPNNGKIGINVVTPLEALHVSGNTLITGSLTANTISATTHLGGTYSSTGTYGNINVNASNNQSMIVFSGSGTVGGTGYTDFIKVTNTSAGAVNPNKTIRVNNTGSMEFINSTYLATIFSISDNGIVTITSPASVTSNSATTNTLNIGTHGQLFDDGNFHIHTNTGSLWLNSLDGGAIRLGTQTNTGNSAVIVDTATVGHSFFTKVQSGFNVAFGTEITMDNLKIRINGTGSSNGVVQAGSVSGSFAAYTTLVGNVAGAAIQGDTNSGGITFTTTYQNISAAQKTLSVGGDTTTLHLIDTTNNRIYRITAIHCQGTTGGYTSIERMA